MVGYNVQTAVDISHPDSKHLRERLPVANPGIQAETDWWMRWCSGATSGTLKTSRWSPGRSRKVGRCASCAGDLTPGDATRPNNLLAELRH